MPNRDRSNQDTARQNHVPRHRPEPLAAGPDGDQLPELVAAAQWMAREEYLQEIRIRVAMGTYQVPAEELAPALERIFWKMKSYITE